MLITEKMLKHYRRAVKQNANAFPPNSCFLVITSVNIFMFLFRPLFIPCEYIAFIIKVQFGFFCLTKMNSHIHFGAQLAVLTQESSMGFTLPV